LIRLIRQLLSVRLTFSYIDGCATATACSLIMHLITINIKYKLKHPQYSYNTKLPTYPPIPDPVPGFFSLLTFVMCIVSVYLFILLYLQCT